MRKDGKWVMLRMRMQLVSLQFRSNTHTKGTSVSYFYRKSISLLNLSDKFDTVANLAEAGMVAVQMRCGFSAVNDEELRSTGVSSSPVTAAISLFAVVVEVAFT